MTDDLPEPLTPPDCDLRDFPFMPLDVLRLRDSDLAAIEDAEAFRAAVMSWCASWHQVPAGSLPNDDAALARLLGYGRDLKTFRRVKEGALRGYVLCSDGRLYHRVVAEKAVEAWSHKERQRDRGRKGNEVRWGSRKDRGRIAQGSHKDRGRIEEGLQNASPEDRKGQGQGEDRERTGTKKERTPNPTPLRDAGDNDDLRSERKTSDERPPGWNGQWRGLRANGTSPRQVAAAEDAAKPPPPEPEGPIWQAVKRHQPGATMADFRTFLGKCTIDGDTITAPTAFLASQISRDFRETLEAEGWRVERAG